ncbi:MAG TPA: hypothetical protein VNC50_21905, partial [Planctomycetia bacterium]|nr:hypothetical protein [Planctomycetia bacterium]
SGSPAFAGVLAALILAGGYAAWRSAARLEGLEAALRADRLLKTTADANPEEVDEAIALLQTEAAHSPQHPIVRSRLGERLIDRYRLAAYATFKKAAPATPPEQLWDRTDLGELYGHVMRLERARRPADLDALRAEPAVAANLAPAKEELEAAARYGPLLPWPRIRLAQLAYLGDSSARQRRLLDAAQRMAPGDSEIAYRCGLVDYYANRPERALASWRRSLEIEHKFFAPIFLSSHRWLGIRTTLDEALPPDAALLVRIADSYFGQNSKTPEPARSADRGEILRQALAALPKMPKGAAKAKTAALLYTLGNEPKLAEESFEEAISLAPHDWNMRLRYASLLESEKRYADAARQAEIAYNLSSRNPTVGEHLARLERLAARGRGP